MTPDPWIKKAKWLTQALIISGTLNVGLLCTFLYSALSKDKESTPLELAIPTGKEPSEKIPLAALIDKYKALTFQELLTRLSSKNHVESGYTRRDVALACLVKYHHFDLERALGGPAPQKRAVADLTLYPGLADYQYQAVATFAKTEKWPYTPEGLHASLHSQAPTYDPTLVEAFTLTPEFHFIQMLFTRTGLHLKKEHTAHLLSQASWSTLTETRHHLETNAAFTIQERRHLLLELLAQSSPIAAKVLIETDQEYCHKHLDNEQLLQLITLLSDRAPTPFLKTLLASPRSDEIWKKATSLLYEQAAEKPPETLNLQASQTRFMTVSEKTYTVVAGDSLWKIAHAHGTTIQALREANNLRGDQLRIGQTLKLP